MLSNSQSDLKPLKPCRPDEVEVTRMTAQNGKICFEFASRTVFAPASLVRGQGDILCVGGSPGSISVPEVVAAVGNSGDGSLENVGLLVSAKVQCPDCCQRFNTEKAMAIHRKFLHGMCAGAECIDSLGFS